MIWKTVLVMSIAHYVLCEHEKGAVSEQKVTVHHSKPYSSDHSHGEKKSEHHEEYAWAYPSYEFSYKVNDPHTHDIKGQNEKRHGDEVKGIYWLLEPNGHKRTVNYHANDQKGFDAQVDYSPYEKHNENTHDINQYSVHEEHIEDQVENKNEENNYENSGIEEIKHEEEKQQENKEEINENLEDNDSKKNNHEKNEHEKNENEENEHEKNEHEKIEHENNEHGKNEHEKNEHEKNEHDKNEHDKNEHDKNEHDKNEHDKNEHGKMSEKHHDNYKESESNVATRSWIAEQDGENIEVVSRPNEFNINNDDNDRLEHIQQHDTKQSIYKNHRGGSGKNEKFGNQSPSRKRINLNIHHNEINNKHGLIRQEKAKQRGKNIVNNNGIPKTGRRKEETIKINSNRRLNQSEKKIGDQEDDSKDKNNQVNSNKATIEKEEGTDKIYIGKLAEGDSQNNDDNKSQIYQHHIFINHPKFSTSAPREKKHIH